MHYTAMLCLSRLGKQQTRIGRRCCSAAFKADEASQALNVEARMLSPENNNERQPIHDHESVSLKPVVDSPRRFQR